MENILMGNIDWNAIIQLVILVSAVIYSYARMEQQSKTSKDFYQTGLESIKNQIDTKMIYLEKQMDEKFNGMSERFHSVKHDISRLERKQEESNRIKERLAIVEAHDIISDENIKKILKALNATKDNSEE